MKKGVSCEVADRILSRSAMILKTKRMRQLKTIGCRSSSRGEYMGENDASVALPQGHSGITGRRSESMKKLELLS